MHSVRITYFDASQLWNLFEQNIADSVPLKNVGKSLTVKKASSVPNSPSPAPAAFPLVNVSFVPYSSDLLTGNEFFEQHKRPLVHLFLASCEDIDVYRSDVRPKLISWLESMPNRRFLKLIVFLIEKSPFSVDNNKSSKAFLADKIRFDFGDKANLNVLSMKHQSDGVLSGVPECIELISNCTFASASGQLEVLDDEIRKIDSQRLVPGWNYCKFFIAKEEKALLNLSLGLTIEALLAYEELEAVYDQIQENFTFDTNLPPREHISGQDLFALEGKPYHELIYRNEISAYDFGVYLFTRQALILSILGRFADVVAKTKRLACTFTPLNSVAGHQKDIWIFDAIICACRFLHSQRTNSYESIKSDLADLLLLAESMIKIAEMDVDLKTVDTRLDFSKLPYYAELEKFHNLASFKASLLHWCKNALDCNSTNGITTLLRIARLYCDAKLFKNCADTCEELISCLDKVNWHRLKISAYELAYKSYKQLGTGKRFAHFAFEYLKICTESKIDYKAALKEIEVGLLNINEDVILPFSNYFAIEDVKICEEDSVAVFISPLIDLSDIPVVLKASFSGELSDLNLESKSIRLRFNEVNQMILPLKKSANATCGTFRLKTVSVVAGKIEWNEDAFASSERAFEVTLDPFKVIDFSCSLPDDFDFSKPSIKVNAGFSESLNEIRISAFCADLSLTESVQANLSGSSSAEFILNASRFIPGEHKIKLSATYTTTSNNQIQNMHVWRVISFPRSWIVEARMIHLENSHLASLFIYPDITEPVQLKAISVCDKSTIIPFRHEIIPASTPLHFSTVAKKVPEFIILYFESALHGVSSYKITVKTASSKTTSSYCRIMNATESLNLGEITRMQAKVSAEKPVVFDIEYDPDCWMVSGPCSGTLKGSFEFDVIPIKPGTLILPTLSFPLDNNHIHNYNQGTLIRCVNK